MYEVGNDFSSLQNAISERNRAMQAGFQHGISTIMSGIAMRKQQQEAALQRNYQERSFQEALKQRAYENAVQQQQALLANKRLDVQQAVSQGYLDLGKQQLEMQKTTGTPAQVRDREFVINRATADADQGMFESAQDILSKYPTVPREMADVLASHSADARQRINDSHQFGQNAAATLNRLNQIPLEMKALKDKHNWVGVQHSNDADAYNKLDDEQKKLQKAEALLRSNKNFSSLVTFDPASGNFVNSASAPRWGATAPAASTDTAHGGGQPESVSATPAVPPLAPASGSPFYNRVNQLIQSGLNPVEAKRRALAESISSSASQGLPDPSMSQGPMGYNSVPTLPP